MSLAAQPSEKVYRHGTDRACDPEVTWARVSGVLPELGITRVADLTHLDVIGVPVFAAYQPLSRNLVTSLGKGLTTMAARVSAAMEAVETEAAVRPTNPLRYASLAEICAQGRVIDVDRLPRRLAEPVPRHLPLLWLEGEALRSGEPTWVPYSLVTTDYGRPSPPGAKVFRSTTTGLASGNSLAEASVHALAEDIERDAHALWSLSGAEEQVATQLDLASVDDPSFQGIVTQIERAGCRAAVWEITSDVGIPAFGALVAAADGNGSAAVIAEGFGCHPRREIALLRALTEAVQSRLAVISGARDDMHSVRSDDGGDNPAAVALRRVIAQAGCRDFLEAPTFDHSSFEEDLGLMLESLASVGAGESVLVDLTTHGINVVRILVPGLELMRHRPLHVDSDRGRRALARRPPSP